MEASQLKILLIEDKKEDSLLVEKVLRAEAYDLTVVSDARQGLKALKQGVYHIVITEMHIGASNAADITKTALDYNPDAAVIVMTVHSFVSNVIDIMEQGAYGYILKPLNEKEIRIVVRRAHERMIVISSGAQNEELTEMSVKDALTGTFNRRFMNIFLAKKIEKSSAEGASFAIVMCDIDFFKKFNDTYGHQAGDDILKEAAQVFIDATRDSDAIFRYGGEEFLIYLNNITKPVALEVADRIRNMFAIYLPATISMGVAAFSDDADTMENLIMRADAALYASKKNGRNRVTAASAELENNPER